MRDSRTKNAYRNIVAGLIYKSVVLLLPFISRTLIIYLIGTSILGVNTLFSSILSFLSLAELGFGSAIVYSMYKPIAENNTSRICALLNYYRYLYRVVGLSILGLGLLLLPFLKLFINGTPPEGTNIYVLYIIYLINTAISYFAVGYRQSLLIAYQRSDIRDKISTIITLAIRLFEIAVIFFTRNIYIYASTSVIGTVVNNITVYIVTNKLYPEIKCIGSINKSERSEIGKKIRGLFGTKLNSIVVNQADNIVISAFLGLVALAQYSNYFHILSTVSGFVMIVFSSMTAGIGNKIEVDDAESVFGLFRTINFMNNWVVGWCSICLACLYQPFMIIWVKQELALSNEFALLMAAYFYIYQIQRTILTFKDAGGLWYEDRFRPIFSMTFNLLLNLLLINLIGINGVVISTIIVFLVSVPWCNYVVFKYLFKKSALNNIREMVLNFLVTLVIGAITYLICLYCPSGILGLLIRLAICIVLPNGTYYLIYRNKQEFYALKQLVYKAVCKRG